MSEELKPCPCGGKMELLNGQRHMKQRVSRERFEIVCDVCGLTVKHPSKSTHKLIGLWNTRQPDTELVDALEKIVLNVGKDCEDCLVIACQALTKHKEKK